MKREQLKEIFPEITDEQLKAILDINSSDIGKAKGDFDTLKAELDTAKENAQTMAAEMEKLKASGANAEEIQKAFDDFKANVDKAEAERQAIAEKTAKQAELQNRFDSLDISKYGKGWYNEPTKNAYMAKFAEALENKDNKGRSDADILLSLVKEDTTAFMGNAAPIMHEGVKSGNFEEITREKFEKMSVKERTEIYNKDKELYDSFTKKGD